MTKAVTETNPNTGVVAYDYGQEKGAGWEGTTAADFKTPFLNLLQALNPELQKADPKYIKGAEAGMFLNSVTGELIDGEAGVILVPVCSLNVFNEWVPRDSGGGFRGAHAIDSAVVQEAKARNPGKLQISTKDGNDLIETFELYCLMLPGPDAETPSGAAILSITSSKIKNYKKLNSQLQAVPGQPPRYAFRVLLRAVPDKGPKGPYFNVGFSPAVGTKFAESLMPPTSPILAAARTFRDLVMSGKVQVDRSQSGTAPAEGDGVDEKF